MRLIKRTGLLSLSLFFVIALLYPQKTNAAFNKNRLIDDLVFNKRASMTVLQINSFLNKFPNSCISTDNGFESPDPIGYTPSSGYKFGDNVSAGAVIYHAAQAYNLNPEVLLATLQKEQSLVGGGMGCYPNEPNPNWPSASSPSNGKTFTCVINDASQKCTYACTHGGGCINIAVGYDCPYYCATKSEGFSKQIIKATWSLKFNQQRSLGNYNWNIQKPGWDNSDDPLSTYSGPMTQGYHKRCASCAERYYDGYTTIDGQSVHMDTGGTVALYRFTPFFSGNSKFVTIFENWFGSTQHVVNYRLISCSNVRYLVERYKPTKRAITDVAVREWELSNALFLPEDKACDYPSYSLPLNTVAQSRSSLKKYFLNMGTFYRIQSSSIARAWGIDTEYSAPTGNIPMLDGETIDDLLIETKLPRLAKSSSTSKVYLLDRGKIHHILGTPSNDTNLRLIRGYEDVPMATFSADYLSEVKAATTEGGAINASFNVGGQWYLFDHGQARAIKPEFVADRWTQLSGLLTGPDLSADVPGIIGISKSFSKGFRRDGTYYVVRVGGLVDSTTSRSQAEFWQIHNEPTITHLLRGVILATQ